MVENSVVLKFIQTVNGSLVSAERVMLIALTAAIAIIMMVQVVLRYFFSAPLFWAEEISTQLLVFVTLFGMSMSVHQGALVSIDFLTRVLSGRRRHVLKALLGSVMLVLFVFIAWLGWQWMMRPEVRMELVGTTQLPRWYNYVALPLAMTMMAWHQFAAILRELRAIGRGVAS